MRRFSTFAAHYLRARFFASLSGERLRHYQDRRARKMIAYAIEHSPFYRRRFAGLPLENWRHFPPITKTEMMAEFDDFTTCGVRLEEAMRLALAADTSGDHRATLRGLTVGLSSGTTGHRGLFVVNDGERAAWAGTLLSRVLPRFRIPGFKACLFLRAGSRLYESTRSPLVTLRYYDLMTPLGDAVQSLNQFRPDLLVAPPSLLSMFASEQIAGRLGIGPLRVISVAEVLDPEDERHISAAFGLPVHQIYQCTEGLLAASCSHAALHVMEDVVALQYESVDPDNQDRVTPIVTDLWRRTQPILRYRLNDILVLDHSPCSCGSAFQKILRIEGRQDDLFYFERNDGAVRTFFPDVMRRMILLASDGISDYEIIQEGAGRIRFHIEVSGDRSFATIEEAVRLSAVKTLDHYSCHAAQIDVVRGLPPRLPNEKRRRVRRSG
jgi:putative adenylate-forming enzyme